MPAELTIMCFDMKKKWTSMSVPLTADVNAVKSTHEVVFLNSRKCWILFLGPETKGKHTRLERFPTIMKEPQLPPTTAGMIQRHVQSPQPLRSRIVSANGPRKNQYYLAQSLFPLPQVHFLCKTQFGSSHARPWLENNNPPDLP